MAILPFLFNNLILIWSLPSFVTDVVDIYYEKDETVQEDEEIQAFVKDVCSFGMQDFDQCGKYTHKTNPKIHLKKTPTFYYGKNILEYELNVICTDT